MVFDTGRTAPHQDTADAHLRGAGELPGSEADLTASPQRTRLPAASLTARMVVRLQRTIGNAAVSRFLATASPAAAAQSVQRQVDVNQVTPEEEAFVAEHGAIRGLVEDAGATAANNLGAPGPNCSAEMAAHNNYWGYTITESISPTLTATLASGVWTAAATNITGNWSMSTRLLSGVTEVTGPGGNTSKTNYTAQVRDLRALSRNWGTWFMLQAIVDHENVHATRMGPSLHDVEAPIQALFAALTVPNGGAVNSEATAITAIQASPGYAAALANAYALWRARYFVLIAGDHNGTAGPSYDAERAVVNPMIARINAHATDPAQHWGPAA